MKFLNIKVNILKISVLSKLMCKFNVVPVGGLNRIFFEKLDRLILTFKKKWKNNRYSKMLLKKTQVSEGESSIRAFPVRQQDLL